MLAMPNDIMLAYHQSASIICKSVTMLACKYPIDAAQARYVGYGVVRAGPAPSQGFGVGWIVSPSLVFHKIFQKILIQTRYLQQYFA
jgi:hypothetical protein